MKGRALNGDLHTIAPFWRYLTAAQTCESAAAHSWLVKAAQFVDRSDQAEALTRRRLIEAVAKERGVDLVLGTEGALTALDPLKGLVSVVTACRDRNENLLRALPTWLACSQVGEVVIVDWTSQIPVRSDLDAAGVRDPRIKIIRVEDEPRWILSLAFNVGFQYATLPLILKADADILIDNAFFKLNPRPTEAFVAGNWRLTEARQSFTNGFFYIARDQLEAAGGFNEFITTYGWDDEELYARLVANGLARVDVVDHSITHLDHDDFQRTGQQTDETGVAGESLFRMTQFLTRRNRFIATLMPEWSSNRPKAQYNQLDSKSPEIQLVRISERKPPVPDAVVKTADLCAAREIMAWRLGELCLELPLSAVERLINSHRWSDISLKHVRELLTGVVSHDAIQSEAMGRRGVGALFVDAQHGLGNRLRAIGSAAAVAKAQNRELVIVWRPDHHCDCKFGDLFEYDGPVIEDGEPATLQDEGGVFINYMEVEPGARKDAKVTVDPSKELYFRSAYVMNHEASSWDAENAFLRSLRPVTAVTDLVASVRHPNAVSAHVRMGSGPGFDHLPWEAAENWSDESHRELAHWREKSHVSRFEKRLDQLIGEGRAETIFLAADLPETYERLLARYPDRIAHLSRPVNDRSGEQLRHALADAILLGQSNLLLGSTWSSFTELALRLAPRPPAQEMSGTDF